MPGKMPSVTDNIMQHALGTVHSTPLPSQFNSKPVPSRAHHALGITASWNKVQVALVVLLNSAATLHHRPGAHQDQLH